MYKILYRGHYRQQFCCCIYINIMLILTPQLFTSISKKCNISGPVGIQIAYQQNIRLTAHQSTRISEVAESGRDPDVGNWTTLVAPWVNGRQIDAFLTAALSGVARDMETPKKNKEFILIYLNCGQLFEIRGVHLDDGVCNRFPLLA